MSAAPTDPEASSKTRDDSLLAELQRLADRTYRLNRHTSQLFGINLACFALFSLVNLFHPLDPQIKSAVVVVFAGVQGCGLLVSGSASLLRRRRLKTLMTALKEDVHAVGPLAQLTHRREHFSIANQAVETLLALLPRMETADSRRLSDRQMQALLALLDTSGHPSFDPERLQKSLFYRFCMSITNLQGSDDNRVRKLPPVLLKALERSGDSRAIEPVKRLAVTILHSLFQQEARECLAVLQQQAAERDRQRFLLLPSSEHGAQETLLRPTTPHQDDPQPKLLLRAARGQAEASPARLVRAASSEEQE